MTRAVRAMRALLLGLALLLSAPASRATEARQTGTDAIRLATLQAKFRRLAAIPFPAEDPFTPAKARLGRLLFYDPLLSGARVIACATCHNPGLSWADGLPRALGAKQAEHPRRTPTLLDVAWTPAPGWAGQFRDLEAVAFVPITSSLMMNLPDAAELVRRLSAIPGYAAAFAQAFPADAHVLGGAITPANIERALATFERTIVAAPAPFDRWIAGDAGAIDASAQRGFLLFTGRGRCAECHSGFSFTDSGFHDIGVPGETDAGRGERFPRSVALQHAFKTPTLRDVARRGPYMHDGSVPTLAAVIDLYDRGGTDRPSRDALIRPLGLSAGDKADLNAFLHTLTGAPRDVPAPVLPR